MTEEAASVVTGYLQTLSTVWLAEDVTLIDAHANRAYAGRAGAIEWLGRTFLAGAQACDIHLVVSGEHVAAEWGVRPREGGTVQMGVFAVVEAGEISALRIYGATRGSGRTEEANGRRSKEGEGNDTFQRKSFDR